MASYIERGDSLFIPFRNGISISDSQCRPRMYKSKENFEKSFPTHNLGNKDIELVEYKEVRYGEWILEREPDGTPYCFHCSICDDDFSKIGTKSYKDYCPDCGAVMKPKESDK